MPPFPVDHLAPEVAGDLLHEFPARGEELVGQGIGVEHGNPGALEHPPDRGLSRGDPAGEPDPEH